MKKPVLLLLASSLASMSFGQAAQIVFNVTAGGQPYMVWNPNHLPANNAGAYLVIDNPSNNALWYQPGNSNVLPANTGIMRTEAPQNKIRWAVGGNNLTFTIPYANQGNVPMPLTYNKTGGPGIGSVVFSTYSYYPYLASSGYGGGLGAPAAWDNFQYMPPGVTHMNDYFTGLPNNSNNAVDRFWIINGQETNPGLWLNYAAQPSASMTFVCPNADVQAGNAITTGVGGTELDAQRFNTGVNKWGDFLPGGTWTGGLTSGQVVTPNIASGNFFPSWTLSSEANPLPIELTGWEGDCDGKDVVLTWSTASEHNNDFFTIEKSRDAQVWSELGQVDAAGNSANSVTYHFTDETPDGLAYYRLSQTDDDGTHRELGVIAAGCDANSTEIVNTWDDGTDLNVMVSSTDAAIYDLVLTDAQGKVLVSRPAQAINQGYTGLKVNKAGIARGIYVVSLINAEDVMTRRVAVQ